MTYLIPGTLGTSQQDLGLPSEDEPNCFLEGSRVSDSPIPNNWPSVTETKHFTIMSTNTLLLDRIVH